MSTPVNPSQTPNEQDVENAIEPDLAALKINWLTPGVRKSLYGLAASLGTVLIVLGVINGEEWAHILGAIGGLTNLLSAVTALLHVNFKPQQAVAQAPASQSAYGPGSTGA